ncbi:metal-dependent hydrolase [Candidatus Woesearchaeota archaeon]|nr:metal-dependent hydrolase [Candidatus Woesearchaeota archaeon]
MKIKYLGHASFKIGDLLVDPWLEEVKEMGLTAPHKWTAEDKDAKVMVITHDHPDHLQGAFDLAKKNKMTVAGLLDTVMPAMQQGVNTELMNVGGPVETGGWKIALVPAIHSGNATGAILKKGKLTVYHAGDTALFSDMKLIGRIYKPDVAILPIGGRFTMDEFQASIAAQYIGADIVIPMHYNTFPLIQADPHKFRQMVEDQTKSKVRIMDVGEEFDLG